MCQITIWAGDTRAWIGGDTIMDRPVIAGILPQHRHPVNRQILTTGQQRFETVRVQDWLECCDLLCVSLKY